MKARARAVEDFEVAEAAPLLVHVAGPTEEAAALAAFLKEQLRAYPGARLVRTGRPIRWRGRYLRETFQMEAPAGG